MESEPIDSSNSLIEIDELEELEATEIEIDEALLQYLLQEQEEEAKAKAKAETTIIKDDKINCTVQPTKVGIIETNSIMESCDDCLEHNESRSTMNGCGDWSKQFESGVCNFSWLDIMEVAPSSPINEMVIWYGDSFVEEEMTEITEFGATGDYSQLYHGGTLYGCLWEDNL
ncbi:hypothetical protein U1Q18_016637 [Sarracenia purpurea var. burkii]